jgi:hypothetical protein
MSSGFITGSSVEIGDVASPHWPRGHRLHTTHVHCVLGQPDGRRRVTATSTTAFIPNVDVVISYGRVKSCPSSHRLCPITQLEQAGYGKKSCRSLGSTFSHNRLARAGYVVLTRLQPPTGMLPRRPRTRHGFK